jgi:hypothetical protein
LFWREAYFGTIDVPAWDRLGWATDEEFSLRELPMQCHANDGYEPRCYLAGPDDGPSAEGLIEPKQVLPTSGSRQNLWRAEVKWP